MVAPPVFGTEAPVLEGNRAYLAGDCPTAVRLIEPAALQGNPEAEKVLADMYRIGRCKDKDSNKAYELNRKAAVGGMPLAQYNMAVALELGEGVAVNLPEAVKW
jgi:TPR repeat protein